MTLTDPAVTAPDGGNTSFFVPGSHHRHERLPPYVPGQPSTATNLSQDLPSFFGTSSAAPNAAAVAALMLQEVPNLTPAEIRAGLITSAESTPMNGSSPGHVDAAGGLRSDQRRQGDQRRRISCGSSLDQSGQRLDGHGDPQRHHGHLQQAGELRQRLKRPT